MKIDYNESMSTAKVQYLVSGIFSGIELITPIFSVPLAPSTDDVSKFYEHRITGLYRKIHYLVKFRLCFGMQYLVTIGRHCFLP